jgi:DNA-binding GntR family transcriptional regulator
MNKPLSQVDQTYQAIRRLLRGGPQRLSRRRLALELGASQASVQAALGRLESEGLLETRPQSGTHVRVVDMDEYQRLYDLREILESYTAGRAATRISPRQLARIDRALRAHAEQAELLARGRTSKPTRAELDLIIATQDVFHVTILEAADNPMAKQFVENLRMLGYYARFAQSWSRTELVNRLRTALAEHTAIADALRAGRAEDAERLMREHIHASRYRPEDKGPAPINDS